MEPDELCLVQEGLWWLPLSGQQREAVRKAVLLAAVLAALGGLEGRVIFRAFGQYIMLHPPWSYLVVTVALYGSAALLAMHFAGRHVPASERMLRALMTRQAWERRGGCVA